MRQVMIRYKVKPGTAETNEALVRDVYEELRQSQPGGLSYGTFKLEDGLTFVHIASHSTDTNPLPETAAFQRFQADLRARCDEPPVVTELREVGSYRLFGEGS